MKKPSKLMQQTYIDEYLNPATDLYEAVHNVPAGKNFGQTIKDLCKFYNENMNPDEYLTWLKSKKLDENSGAILVASMDFLDAFGPSIDPKFNRRIYEIISRFEKNGLRAYTEKDQARWEKQCARITKEIQKLTKLKTK